MDDQSLRDKIGSEIKKLKQLSWKERLVYVWDYYKPLMAAIVGIVVLINIIVTAYHNMQIETLLSVYLINCNTAAVDSDTLAAEFADYLGGIGKNDEITIDTSVMLDEDDTSQYGVAYQMKFTAVTATSMVDILMMDEEHFSEYEDLGYFEDLSSVLTGEQMEKWKDLLIYGEDEEGNEIPCGINLSGADLIEEYGLYPEGVYGGVLIDAEHMELCSTFFEWLFT